MLRATKQILTVMEHGWFGTDPTKIKSSLLYVLGKKIEYITIQFVFAYHLPLMTSERLSLTLPVFPVFLISGDETNTFWIPSTKEIILQDSLSL